MINRPKKGETTTMKNILKVAKPVSVLLAINFIVTVFYSQYVSAAMIGTEVVSEINSSQEEAARIKVHRVLAREDVRDVLTKQGLDPTEVLARVDSLTDALGVILGVALIVFLVLLITDILGYTDIFPFVKKTHR